MARQNGALTVLNVAEKNDAAKEISRVLSSGRSQRREGFSKFNKIYEFDCNMLNSNCKMIMTSVSGHLLDLEFAGNFRNWNGCSPASLFSAPVARFCPEQYQNIKRTLEREVRRCQALVIWTDCDREGENIGFEIIEVCKNVKQNIRVYRAKFSEITYASINRACRGLIEPDIKVSDAVEVRRELDLRIGAAFTRFQTLRLQKKFPDVLSEQLISYGSCQFPTLGFVAERYKQIQDFIPEIFYKIKVVHVVGDSRVEYAWGRGRLFHEQICRIFCDICLERPIASVISVSSKPKSKWRPVALDTVELEKLASRELRISAKETMRIAEKLYTQAFISYPRTETNMFPRDFDLVSLVRHQIEDPNWGEFAANILNTGVNPRNGHKTDSAHPPIHPIKYTNTLQGNEKRIYEFIVRHFLACLSQDAKGNETTVEIKITEEKFSANGLVILERNYLDVYPYDYWKAKTLPAYHQGTTFQPDVIEMVNGETSPPSLLTEADLIALMDKHGIGTDATHAEHIETIKNRRYVGEQENGSLIPGELGMGLVEGYDSMGFEMSKPHLRAELERDLKCICEGAKRKEEVLEEHVRKYKEVFLQACEKAEQLDQSLSTYFGQPSAIDSADINPTEQHEISEPIRKCPKCGSFDLVIRRTKEGSLMLGCQGFPNCKNSIFLPKFVLKATCSEVVCDLCQPRPVRKINFEFKKGSVPPMMSLQYTGCLGGCDHNLTELIDIRGTGHGGRGVNGMRSRGGSTSNMRGSRANANNQHNTEDRNFGRKASGRGVNAGGASLGQSAAFERGALGQGSTFRNRSNSNSNSRNGWDRNTGATAGGSGKFRDSGYGSTTSTQTVFSRRSEDGDNAVMCDCDQPAQKLIVRKEGPNQGRHFYKCGNNNGCNFFLWANEGQQSNGDTRNTGSIGAGYQNRGATAHSRSTNSNDQVKCKCNMNAVSRTVSKEGPNKGRPFYSCQKPMANSCGFFQWGDEEFSNSNNFQSNQRGSFGGRRGWGRGNERGTTRRRKCGICGEEGHTKKTCKYG